MSLITRYLVIANYLIQETHLRGIGLVTMDTALKVPSEDIFPL